MRIEKVAAARSLTVIVSADYVAIGKVEVQLHWVDGTAIPTKEEDSVITAERIL